MQRLPPRYRAQVRWLVFGFGCLLALGFVLPLFHDRDESAERFIAEQSDRLRKCKTLLEAQRVAHFARSFPDGTWVAVVSEHACSSGAGFDATVFWDSEGVVRVNRSHHFCGLEGLEGELNRVTATSLKEFYAGLHQCQLAQLP